VVIHVRCPALSLMKPDRKVARIPQRFHTPDRCESISTARQLEMYLLSNPEDVHPRFTSSNKYQNEKNLE
jgi:hypothetical protein